MHIKRNAKKPLSRKKRIRRFLRKHFFNKRAAEGSVTIFLVIIMLPMLVFSFSVVDLCKILMAKSATESSLDLSLNAALTGYDSILKDMYGIMASSSTEEELTEKITAYYVTTLESSGFSADGSEGRFQELTKSLINSGINADEINKNSSFLKVFEGDVPGASGSVEISPVEISSVSNPEVMHRQIVEYMKYRGPVYLASGALDKIGIFKDLGAQSKAASKKVTFDKSLSDVSNEAESLYKQFQEYFENSDKLESSISFSKCYSGGQMVVPQYIEDELENAAASIMFCSYYHDELKSNSSLPFSDRASKAFDGSSKKSKDSGAAVNLEIITKTMEGYNYMMNEDTLKGYFNSSSSGKKYADEIIGNESRIESVLEFYAPCFRKSIPDSPADAADMRDFLEYYHDAEEAYNAYSADEDTADLAEEVSDALEAAKPYVEKIEACANLIQSRVSSEYSYADSMLGLAEGNLQTYISQLKAQIDLLEAMPQTIDKVVTSITNARNSAQEYEGAINDVKTDSTKAALTAEYKTNAENLEKIDTSKVQELKDLLNERLEIYKAAKESLKSLKIYGKDLVDETVFKNLKTKEPKVTDLMKTYYNANESDWLKLESASSYVTSSGADASDIKAWNGGNDKIKASDFYKVVEKIGKPARETEKDESSKNKVNDESKNVKNKSEEAMNSAESGDPDVQDAETDFVPADYELFREYIQSLDYNVDSGDENTPNSVDGNKASADNVDNTCSVLNSIGDFFASLFEATRDNLYISEYLTENFPCFTTNMGNANKDEAMISGQRFVADGKAQVVWSNAELEYILYGQDTKAANIAAASGVIFGVRFAFNLIYALTNPEINAETLSIATAAVGAIPFAVPIVKVVLQIGLAIAESGIDVASLLAGEEVAVIKTQDTWVCSISGLVKKAGEELVTRVVEPAAEKLIDKASEGLCDLIDQGGDALNNAAAESIDGFNELCDEQVKLAKEKLENDVWNPFIQAVNDTISGALTYDEDYTANVEKYLNETIDTIISDLEKSDAEGEDVIRSYELMIFRELRQNTASYASAINSNIEQFFTDAENAAKEALTGEINGISDKVKAKLSDVENKITGKMDEFTEKVKGKVSEAVNEVVDKAKEGVVKGSEQVKTQLHESLNKSLHSQQKVSLKKDSNSGGKVSLSKEKDKGQNTTVVIKMSYKDYLYIFTVIGLACNESNMLQRSAQLMCANVRLKSGNNSYDINRAHTLFEGRAGSQVRTVFWGTTWSSDEQRWVAPASNVYKYTATSYAGY